MKSRRGQVSTELLFIIAAILVLFIPLLVITYFKANEANEQIMQLQAQVVAIRLSELANSVGSASGKSAVIAEVFIPSTVSSMSIISSEDGGEIVLKSNTQTGENDIVGTLRFPVDPRVAGNSFKFPNAGLVRFNITKELVGGKELIVFRLN